MEPTLTLTGILDPRGAWSADACSIARTLEVVGTRSAVLLLREAFYGATRFDDFAERVGVSDAVAAARLRDLVDEGLLERHPYRDPGQRARSGYRLTAKGAEVLPILVALMQWGDRWLAPNGPPVVLEHRSCGEPVSAELRCAGGHLVGAGEISVAAGPGSSAGAAAGNTKS